MDYDKILAALQHLVGAVHQLAVASPSGHPHVVALANAAQTILNDLIPQPEPVPQDDGTAEAQADEADKPDPAKPASEADGDGPPPGVLPEEWAATDTKGKKK